MTQIKAISDLRNHFSEISNICHETGEPIFLTKNGRGDLVVMSIAACEEKIALMELYKKLGEAEIQSKDTKERMDHDVVFSRLRKRVHE
jgi:prevent-host-death family protein